MQSCKRGLTLVEVLVTLAIFVILAGFMLLAVREVVTQWTSSERRRVLYERAAGVVDTMADDIRLALTQEPAGSSEVKARFIGDYVEENGGIRRQRLIFVRAFEAGPERAITANAADGRANQMMLKPMIPGEAQAAVAAGDPVDSEAYTGEKVGDFKALGGMAIVAYFVKNQTLYRAIRAPVEGTMLSLIDEKKAQALSTDVLFLQFDYWGQETDSWEAPAGRLKPHEKYAGPQRIWDSTRGIMAPPLKDFFLHRGAESLNDPEDDVFPKKVRITITVDSSMPRCLFTKLIDEIGETGNEFDVDNTKGFADGGDDDSYVLIDDEWMRYAKKTGDRFIVDQRGARGTAAKTHAKDAVVRQGKTFHRIVFLPNWREDFMSDKVYFERRKALNFQPRRIVQ